jgi:hypothetical protein
MKSEKHLEIERFDADIPQWEKDFIDQRLDKVQRHPECLKPIEMLFTNINT